ncbi:MAG: N-acetylmuramoyl-L-alanine amidase [bacterium]|nr:N-acetylmuramoyl-L-alanine amidase [bacterium]
MKTNTLRIFAVATLILLMGFLLNSVYKTSNLDQKISLIKDNNQASVFFVQSSNPELLKQKYSKVKENSNLENKIRVLIVPGHEPNYGGAEYRGLKERDMNLELAEKFYEYLDTNSKYYSVLTRDENGWNEDLEKYFTDKKDEVNEWQKGQKLEMSRLISDGAIKKVQNAYHNNAPSNVALRLYAINKWASENKFDIVIHIHFNDDPTRRGSVPGKYSGFSIYMPERQYSNANSAQKIANFVFRRLVTYGLVSTLKTESDGLIEDQDLIAIGSYNTADAPSILIEYGYIYESQFIDKNIRSAMLKEYAYQTYIGLENFFGQTELSSEKFDNTLFPKEWNNVLKKDFKPSIDSLSLQFALMREGFYPPDNMSREECPMSGAFGECTRLSLLDFQKSHNIIDEKGILGSKTRKELNILFSGE